MHVEDDVEVATERAGWWRAAVPLLALLAVGAPFAVAWLPTSRLLTWVIVLTLIGFASWLPARRWMAFGPERRRDALVATAPAVVGAAVSAWVLLVLGVVVTLARYAPDAELFGAAWRIVAVDQGTWLTLLPIAFALAYAGRRVTPLAAHRWLASRGLPEAAAAEASAELRRTRLWRTLPACAGLVLALGPATAYNLTVAVAGPSSVPAEALRATVGGGGTFLAPAIAGYLLGVLAAEVSRRRPRGSVDLGARLQTRRPVGYLTPLARWLPAAVAVTILVATGLRALVGPPAVPQGPAATTALAAAVTLVLGVAAVQHWLIRRPQGLADPVALALDDTFRSSAAHAVVGASSALGLLLASSLLGDVWNAQLDDGLGWYGIPLAILATGLGAAVYAAWFGFGSGHPGVRPRSEEPVT